MADYSMQQGWIALEKAEGNIAEAVRILSNEVGKDISYQSLYNRLLKRPKEYEEFKRLLIEKQKELIQAFRKEQRKSVLEVAKNMTKLALKSEDERIQYQAGKYILDNLGNELGYNAEQEQSNDFNVNIQIADSLPNELENDEDYEPDAPTE